MDCARGKRADKGDIGGLEEPCRLPTQSQVQLPALPVIDTAGMLVGALNVHDLLRAGVL